MGTFFFFFVKFTGYQVADTNYPQPPPPIPSQKKNYNIIPTRNNLGLKHRVSHVRFMTTATLNLSRLDISHRDHHHTGPPEEWVARRSSYFFIT